MWRDLALPVLVTYWDERSDAIYWEFIPVDEFSWPVERRPQDAASILIPIDNILNKQGINKIRIQVAERHARHQRLARCIEQLIMFILNNTSIERIACDPASMAIEYWDNDGQVTIAIFGTHAEKWRLLSRIAGRREDEAAEHLMSVADDAADSPQRSKHAEYYKRSTDEEMIAYLKRKLRRLGSSRRRLRTSTL
jgi:hypothetical protein